MAKLDMVQSYVEKLAGSIWEGATLGPELRISLQYGSALVEIYTLDDETVAFRCTLARDVPATPGLYEWLNSLNRTNRLVKICHMEDRAVGAYVFMRADEIDANRMQTAVSQLGAFSDPIDEELVNKFGGTLANPAPSSPA